MHDAGYDYTLQELLCVREFSKNFETAGLENFSKVITEWAEKEFFSGGESESLLILASLNLDPQPNDYEVEAYLDRYQRSENIANPSAELSALVWLRIQLQLLMAAKSLEEIEQKLQFFTEYFLDFPPRAFASITRILSNFYWQLYDESPPVFSSNASTMSEEELLMYVKQRCMPYYRILINQDWLSILTKQDC